MIGQVQEFGRTVAMHIPSTLGTAALAAVLAVSLAGCESPIFEDTVFDRAFLVRQLPNEEKVLKASTFEPRSVGVVQTYCYTTIGEVDCYAHPLLEERYRLQGYFGPAPR